MSSRAENRPGAGGALRLQILGPLRLWRGRAELDPGPRQQAYLLALLLARAGQSITATELVELIWEDDAPASALNVVHKYVGSLRKVLEPDLPAREEGSYLLRRGNGYVFTPAPGMLDLVEFRRLVARATPDDYVAALSLWHGPAGDGLGYGLAAMPIFAGLDGEFFDACVRAAELGAPERVLPALRLAASMAPLHEPVQTSLISVLGAVGQQAEALAVYRAARARLVQQLGVDPGPALQAAHRRVLEGRRGPALEKASATSGLVGREDELAVLGRAMEPALRGGTGLVLMEGEPGVGKTRLLEEVAAEADRRGAVVVWGRCLEGEGTPSMWPWTEAVAGVLDRLPAAAREERLAGGLGRLVRAGEGPSPDDSTQFRLFEEFVVAVGEVPRPLVLLIDDLQWADVASLQLFGHLAARLPRSTMVVATLRDRAPTPGAELSRLMAEVARMPGQRRVRVGPMGVDEVAELVRRETRMDPVAAVAREIHERTAGNAFFVRELSKLLAETGALTEEALRRAGVPSTVRDAVLGRIADLDAEVRQVLDVAASVGREVDLLVLARVLKMDVPACLDRLDTLAGLGLLEPVPTDPSLFRFTHDLVRESVVAAASPLRLPGMHLRIADALQDMAPGDEATAERLAYHLWAAGPLADPVRTVAALTQAARRDRAKYAFEAAQRHLGYAVQVSRAAGLAELELAALTQLIAVGGSITMYGSSVLDWMERAEYLAQSLGREREAVDFQFSRWIVLGQTSDVERSFELAEQLRRRGEASGDPLIRAYGLHAWGIAQIARGDVRAGHSYLSRSIEALRSRLDSRDEHPLRYDLYRITTGLLAEVTALRGDLDGARAILATMEAAIGEDRYLITIWSTMSVRTAVAVGDPSWASRAADRGIAADPEFAFSFLGAHQRLARCWERALTGDDPGRAVAEAQDLIATYFVEPPRPRTSIWQAMLAEIQIAAGRLDEAAATLDQAEAFFDTYRQRFSEPLILLLRARLFRTRGEPDAVVRAAAERARTISLERGADLVARRAEEFLGLGTGPEAG